MSKKLNTSLGGFYHSSENEMWHVPKRKIEHIDINWTMKLPPDFYQDIINYENREKAIIVQKLIKCISDKMGYTLSELDEVHKGLESLADDIYNEVIDPLIKRGIE